MEKKPNARSIRFSDEVKDLIEQQIGDNFSDKWERLVYNAYMLAPKAEENYKYYADRAEQKRQEANELYEKISRYRSKLNNLDKMLEQVQNQINTMIEAEEKGI